MEEFPEENGSWMNSNQYYSAAHGAKNSFHGYVYQLKLLLLCLKRGLDMNCSFRLASEMEDAMAFDDLVFKYEVNGRTVYRFVQAKHRQRDSAVISANDLLSVKDDPFSLKKYLKSFRGISQNPLFSDNDKETSKEFIICTNAGFNFSDLKKNGIGYKELQDEDFMFKEENGKRYKLNIPNKDHEIFKILQQTSDVYCLAQMLVTCLLKEKPLNLSANLFKEYYEALAREVLQVKHEGQNRVAKFREEFLDCSASLTDDAKVFRSVFQEVYIQVSGESDEVRIREQFANAEFKMVGNVGKVTTEPNVVLPNDIEATNEAIRSFLDQLVFAVNQPNEAKLGRIIREEIGKVLNLVDSDLAVGFMEKEILEWFQKKGKEKGKEGVFLTQENGVALLEMAKNNCQKLILLGSSEIYRKQVEDFGLEFETGEMNMSKLKTFLESQTEKVFIFVSQQQKLSSVKIIQVLKNNYKFKSIDSFLMLNSSALKKLKEQLLCTLKSSKTNLFVIEIKSCFDIEVLEQIFDVVHEGKNQLILISSELHHFNDYLENSLLTFNEVIDKDFFKELSHESQRKVLEYKVIFQGKKVCLKDIFNKPLDEINSQAKEIICDDTLYKLIKNIDISIGVELERIENYVDRTFSFKDNRNIVQPQTAFDVFHKFVIVAAEPGMGKSSFLTQLAHQTKECFPSSWVVRVNLNKQTKLLKEMDFKKRDIQLVVRLLQFLEHVLNLKDPVEKLLFEEAFHSNGNIVVMVDAFDEISPNYKDNVIALLHTLKEKQIKRMWVMTRTHLKKELEKTFNVRAYVIEPFSEEMQKDFLQHNLPQFHSFQIYSLIKSMKNVSVSWEDGEDLVSSPLYLKMIVEIYKGEQNADIDIDIPSLYEKFIDFKFREYKEKMNVDFSEASVSEELERSFERRLKNHKMAALYALFDEFEISKLLPKHERVEAKRYFEEEVKEGKERVGIIIGLAGDMKPDFLHRTFAEYLAALWFCECVQDEERLKDIRPFLKDRMYEKGFEMIREFFDLILAKGFPLHTGFINGHYRRIGSSMSYEEVKTECKRFDRGGRSVLHLFIHYSNKAFAYINYDIMQFLLNDCGLVKVKEKVFEWMPFGFYLRRVCNENGFSYECEISKRVQGLLLGDETELTRDEVVNELKRLGNSVFQRSLIYFYDSNKGKYSEDCYWLFECFKGKSKWKAIQFLIEKGVDVNFRDREGKTVLDYVAKNGDWEGLKYLISEKGADIQLSVYSGLNILHCAFIDDRTDIVKYLIEKKNVRVDSEIVTSDFVLEVARKGNVEFMKLLHSKGVDFLVTDNKYFGKSPLHLAAQCGQLEAVKYLVEQMNADLQFQDDYGYTPLMYATRGINIFKYLAERGSDVNTTNKYGDNVLHKAAFEGQFDILKYLIEVRGLVLKDSKPLIHAIRGYLLYNEDEQFREIQFLLEKGQYDTINKTLWLQRFRKCLSKLDKLELIIALGDEFKV